MNYTYKFDRRGLCSELNSLMGFYESVINEDCQVYINASRSQYFKSVSIYEVFKFPNIFVDIRQPDSEILSTNEYYKAAQYQYKTRLTAQQCAGLFSYTDNFQKKLNKNISKLVLPSKYKCFHIRRGDKVGETLCRRADKRGQTEAKRYDFEDYLKKSDQLIKAIFIMSDDYSSILEAQQHELNINTLTTEDQTGHSTDLDKDNDRHYSEEELVRFFSEIEIAKHAQQFIGAKSSNIFRYIENQCVTDIDFISLD
jgi:hypothetical protein